MMNNNQLLLLSKTIKDLESINHPDSYRVAKEILSFTKFDDKKTTEVISELSIGKPWEYIRGWCEFAGYKVSVTSATLIPRPETVKILDIIKEDINRIENIYDIGTGSGAISIALKKRFPTITITASDISKEALLVANRNIENNKVDIELFESNLLENLLIEPNSLIVANLPYIPTNIYEKLEKSVKDYEPKLALDGGKGGLEIIARLISECKKQKNIKVLVLEIDPSQEAKLIEISSGSKHKFYEDFRGLVRFFKLYF